MKKVLFLLIAMGALSATAKTTDSTATHPKFKKHHNLDLPGWVIDVNLLGGFLNQSLTNANSAGNYLNGVNVNLGNMKFDKGSSFGGDAQVGYFFGRGGHWGIGTGIMYLAQAGTVTLNNYHAEYQSIDLNGNIMRQIVSPNQPIKENLTITNINIPLLLKYKKRFSERWGFTADGGLLYNVQMKNKYSSNASFDYEEVQDIVVTGPGQYTYLYDNSPVPKAGDNLITKNFVSSIGGNVTSYFAEQHENGASVGLGVKPNSNSGTVTYTTGALGFLIQPSASYYFSDNVALNFGLYYLYQGVKNTPQSGYVLTNKMGDYNSPLNNVTKSIDQSYGLNVGVRFLFGRKPPHSSISSEDAMDPSKCDAPDGMIVLHGFVPGTLVAVDYTLNGVPQPETFCHAQANGTVRLTNLVAGAYTNIQAIAEDREMDGTPINLFEPKMSITSQTSTNPTANGLCDGTISLKGLPANEMVTVNCNLNGTPYQPQYAKVSADNTVVLRGLCAGAYTQITAMMGKCSANAQDVTLTAPAPPPPAPVAQEGPKVTDPIYFDINETSVDKGSITIIELASGILKQDKDLVVTINGYADKTGSHKNNQVLSLNRAKIVKKYLVQMGIDANRIKVAAHGDKEPLSNNNTPEGRALNRCAVLQITKAGVPL